MSYDVGLQINTGKTERVIGECHNHTYNCSKMFYDALGKEGINGLNGRKAGDMIEYLEDGIKNFEKKEKLYRTREPSNGWGDYDSAKSFLEDILTDCEMNPNCGIYVC